MDSSPETAKHPKKHTHKKKTMNAMVSYFGRFWNQGAKTKEQNGLGFWPIPREIHTNKNENNGVIFWSVLKEKNNENNENNCLLFSRF